MATKQQLQLGRADDGVKLTHEEFAEAAFEQPWRYERVNGRLSVLTPSGHDHVDAGEPFRDYFVAYKLAHPGKIANVVNEAWILIDDETERIADLAVYLKLPRGKMRIPHLIPELVVETASEGYTSLKRDYEEKREDYWRAGVKEYVIVDRFDHRVTVFRRGRGRFNEQILGPDEVYSTPLLPGLKIPLAKII